MIELKPFQDLFEDIITEAKEQLDVSIKAVGKYVTSETKRIAFLSDNVIVSHKTDGIKVTLVYVNDTGDYTKDWILSYKGEIQYPGEFDFTGLGNIKKSSIANAQFKIVFEHLKKITPSLSGLPLNTELFVEFLMRKPTLSSSYKREHGMVLIASAPCTFTAEYGKLRTSSEFDTSNRDVHAKLLKLDVPAVLFEGVLGNRASFEKGIRMKELKGIYASRKHSMNWENAEILIDDLREMFLEVESVYGGVEEGVVLDFGYTLLKFQQSYQIDQEARKAIKARYNEPTEDENNRYWDNVRLVALDIIQTVAPQMRVSPENFGHFLQRAAKALKLYKIDFSHTKRDEVMIKDDIQGNIKMIARKRLEGNNNFLFLGKFRVLSNMHYNIIKDGLKDFDNGVVCVVTSKDTKDTKDLRTKMVQKAFPNIEIVHHSTGNLFGIMGKAKKNINTVLAGTDRFYSYTDVLKRNPDLGVKEIKRPSGSISASELIAKIDDEAFFKKNTPKAIHSMYKEIKGVYA